MNKLSSVSATHFALGNGALRDGNYGLALDFYEKALQENDEYLASIVKFSYDLALKKSGQKPDRSIEKVQRKPLKKIKLEKPDSINDFFFELIEKSGLFDPDWYLKNYQQKFDICKNPLEHYLEYGVSCLTNPSPRFDTAFYLASNPDVKTSGMHPFLHYVCQGYKEGRARTIGFGINSNHSRFLRLGNGALRDGNYGLALDFYEKALQENDEYLASIVKFSYDLALKKSGQKPDRSIEKVQRKPLKKIKLEKPDSINDFFFELIEKSGLFDPDWYLKNYQQKFDICKNPLEHYLEYGVSCLTNPSPRFDTAFYLASNPDVKTSGMHPFLHYVCQGYKEGRARRQTKKSRAHALRVESPHFVPRLDDSLSASTLCRVIAFYLPQFHPIPENDDWWGKDFTEWTNVRPATPKFRGHYQPHVPEEFLGYYNLTDEKVLQKQIQLADDYGIEAFCFYLYWFSGKRLLEKPLDLFLANPKLKKQFCVCWANENWSRRWDGSENEILIAQRYSEKQDLSFIRDIAKYLRDPRYITINNKKLLIIYRPNLLPDMKRTATLWRQWCVDNGIGDLLIAYVQSFENSTPEKYDLDYAIEFPPSGHYARPLQAEVEELGHDFNGRVLDWRQLVVNSDPYLGEPRAIFRGVCPSWDNTARRKTTATIFANSSPNLFKQWLENAFEDTINRFPARDERLVFINAWNEWAEGAHLEPDKLYGYAWLQAVRDAHISCSEKIHKSIYTGIKDRRSSASSPIKQSNTDILFVSHDGEYGGAQQSLLSIVEFFKNSTQLSVKILMLRGGPLENNFKRVANTLVLDDYDLEEPPDALGEKIVRFCNSRPRLLYLNTVASAELIKLLPRDFATSLIHVRELSASFDRYGKPWIEQIKTGPAMYIACSGAVKEFLIREHNIDAKLVDVVYTSLTNRRVHEIAEKVSKKVIEHNPVTQREIVVLGIGIGMPFRKGVDLFIDVYKQVRELSNKSIVFRWIGEFYDRELVSEEKTWEDYLREIGTANNTNVRIELLPYQPNLPDHLAQADIFLLTSREEPFARVALEAAAAGLPVIGFTESGGVNELLAEIPELLVDNFSPAGMASVVLSLAEHNSLRIEFGKKLAAIVSERYLSEKNFPKLIRICRKLSQTEPRVSVIVPNYNYARYLEQRLDSILTQTYQDFELIILDDASDDGSWDLISRIAPTDDRIITFRNEHNSGSPYPQWFKGLQVARGELIWIAEADDLSSPTFLSEMVEYFRYADLKFAYCASTIIDENGQEIEDYRSNRYLIDVSKNRWNENYITDCQEEVLSALGIKNTVLNISAAIFRKASVPKDLSSQINSMKMGGDWLFILGCIQGGSVAYCSQPLNKHRRHSASVIHKELKSDSLSNLFSTRKLLHDFVTKNFTTDEIYREKVNQYIKALAKEYAEGNEEQILNLYYFKSGNQSASNTQKLIQENQ